MKLRHLLSFLFAVQLASTAPTQDEADDDERSADDDLEELPFELIGTQKAYEIRKYPASKWVCINYEKKLSEDPLKDWRNRFQSPYDAMNSEVWVESDDSKAFMELFKYIFGVNKGNLEINMTRPVTSRVTPIDQDNVEMQLCVWPGSEFDQQELPEPVDPEVLIVERDMITVYVRKFGGYALSVEDWASNYTALKDAIADKSSFDPDIFFGATFSSPFVTRNRRNEIWIEKTTEDDPASETPGLVPDDLEDAEMGSGQVEEWPFEVIESNENYEVRKYPASTLVCTFADNVDVSKDPLKDWQSSFQSPLEALAQTRGDSYPPRQLQSRLKAYLLGVNKDFVEVDKTVPSAKKWMLGDDPDIVPQLEMCAWMSPAQVEKGVPEPAKEEVIVKEIEEMVYYVRRFDGWALSFSDWVKEKDNLVSSMKENNVTPNETCFISACFSDVWQMEDRRNEVWIMAMDSPHNDTNPANGTENGKESGSPAEGAYNDYGYGLRDQGEAGSGVSNPEEGKGSDGYGDEASDPAASDPAASDPAASDPAASDPAASDPAASDPAASDPAASDPAASDPSASDPEASDPAASTYSNPTTTAPMNSYSKPYNTMASGPQTTKAPEENEVPQEQPSQYKHPRYPKNNY